MISLGVTEFSCTPKTRRNLVSLLKAFAKAALSESGTPVRSRLGHPGSSVLVAAGTSPTPRMKKSGEIHGGGGATIAAASKTAAASTTSGKGSRGGDAVKALNL
jgi:hypothetical protein